MSALKYGNGLRNLGYEMTQVLCFLVAGWDANFLTNFQVVDVG